jgi:tetratricopeptide (TPR) repeat protein
LKRLIEVRKRFGFKHLHTKEALGSIYSPPGPPTPLPCVAVHPGEINHINSRAIVKLAAIFVFAAILVSAQTPRSKDPNRQAALALQQQGKLPEAEAAWRAYIKAHPSDPEPYAQLAVLAAHQEHYKEAIPLYRKALAMNPNVPGLRLNLALALFKSGNLKAALPEFEKCLKSAPPDSPDFQRVTILIGMSHYGLAQYSEAAPFLKEGAAKDPQNLPIRLALAHSCLWSKQYQCVMDVYHEILSLDAESAEADMIAGEALDEMKDNAGSTAMFRAAVKANPKEPNVHFGLGYLLWTQKIYPEAATEFQAELANDPNHVQAMEYLGDTLIQLNKPAEARPWLERTIKLDPSQQLAHLDLGIILSDAGENEKALTELQLAAKLKPDDVNVHWRLGRLYRSMGKKEEAKAEFDKASTLNKAADEDLRQKISNGNAPPPANTAVDAGAPQQGQTPETTQPQSGQTPQ